MNAARILVVLTIAATSLAGCNRDTTRNLPPERTEPYVLNMFSASDCQKVTPHVVATASALGVGVKATAADRAEMNVNCRAARNR
ncbi:hypothetical protein [Paracoccus aerodenitrificans]|uniref:hypothetical protein n=1 Tax=Paracoccus aerodenitrificans TaxID=3017781 RepID=UPI0022F0B0E0|nr:hypothetical protein [Paracoccus aerodenitrificans]WBU63192.1 hypothetical protein PAE61_12585 [Paracoccus aerodenitrificans]